MKCLVILTIALGMLYCAPVFAEEPDSTTYIFDDEEVMGTMALPTGVRISGRRPPRDKSLVKVRQNFVHEMLKSVEHI